MKIEKLIDYLQCPYCKNQNLNIQEDSLYCASCNTNYDVVDGIPILVKKEFLNDQEKNQTLWFNKHYSEFSKEEYCLEKWRQSMLKRIFEQDYKNSVRTYLDIGCGATGYTVIEGAKRNNWISFGSDISLEAMIRANNLAKKEGVFDKTAFVVSAAENAPFKNEVFDYVSAISVLEHLEFDEKAVENILLSLKPSGHVYICVPNSYWRMWPFLWPVYYYNDLKIGHKRHYSIEKLDKCFVDKFGCKKEKVFYNGHLIKFLQIGLETFKLIDEKKWWAIEKKDICNNKMGVQLNAIYQKKAL